VQGDEDRWRPFVVNLNRSVLRSMLRSIVFSDLTFPLQFHLCTRPTGALRLAATTVSGLDPPYITAFVPESRCQTPPLTLTLVKQYWEPS
jgi:hypothetical protein